MHHIRDGRVGGQVYAWRLLKQVFRGQGVWDLACCRGASDRFADRAFEPEPRKPRALS